MGEQNQALDFDGLSARPQEILQLVGRLVELDAWRAPAPVTDWAAVHTIAVAVVLVEPPVVSVTVDGGVTMLPLDGDEAAGAEQKMVDLTTPVAVATEQNPVVTE